MGLLDNLKRTFGKGKAVPASESGDTAGAPNGLGKPDGGRNATVLNRKPILIGGSLIALAAAGGYYGFSALHKGDQHSAGSSKITPGPAVHTQLPPDRNPGRPVPPKVASTPQSPAQQMKSGFAAPNHHHHVAQATGPVKQSAQEKAEMVALSGHQGRAWQSQGQPSGKGAAAPGVVQAGGKKSSEAGPAVYDTHIVRRPASPYELMQGGVIPAVLTTAINSDLSGQVTAMVSQNVWDSESGAYLLIPAGAKLVGFYSNKVIAGQTRVGVDWTRILMPNGSYVSLGQMPGASPSGKDGLHDEVNNHTWEIFKNALLMSIIDVGISVSQPGYATAGAYGQQALTPAETGEQSLSQTFGQAESNLLQKYTNIAPTLVIRAGYQMSVAVTKDVVFPGPYNAAPAYRGSASPSALAPAAVANPYPAESN
jgi:type IV secretion system protein VirB10